ncbi:hypothetical protein COV88_01810 [Candidatus Saccharibacteria bacterium CG11_big_fil_rev_8_21_14_0_20_41_19]|nr:hypothetical protein [Candidatus Saccharibacteria bacterium]OIP85742.1 MAG: hypothetical protein AUK57_02720 [Candidatus Saccharibacteria bacterium CG2_30_41_52]PIQ70858.1 MAG: hypothetical protein COV88_01810 [Candidatus Saccharibacteria bacterium CG11_big_fil_rev_8_21_14_0_20_41_19]PIZ60703.1 MAG: hypothetical protein COY18_00800 [Candidatus Saccharibacteria bacterium CG_4_10_14_0_2_um_filter_41_11]PJC29647.1 MAG: hypothetical protein CO052_02050 [Candidatus Saccharibacteria bacterium CG_4
MDFLKIVKRRSFMNEAIYIALNVALAIALMFIIRVTGSLLPAFALVLLSKWRIFAVRLRFWFANIQTNLVSVIIDVSFVIFLYITNIANVGDSQIFIVQCLLSLLYIGWLLLLKPKSKRSYVVAQAGLALFAGIIAVYAMSYGWVASPVILITWLIGYASARHVLGSYDEESHVLLLSLAWSLVITEISWIAYHWTIAYRLPFITSILLPQVSIVILCLGFLSYKAYNSYYHHQKIRINDIILPLIFTVSIVGVLVLAFNSVSTVI